MGIRLLQVFGVFLSALFLLQSASTTLWPIPYLPTDWLPFLSWVIQGRVACGNIIEELRVKWIKPNLIWYKTVGSSVLLPTIRCAWVYFRTKPHFMKAWRPVVITFVQAGRWGFGLPRSVSVCVSWVLTMCMASWRCGSEDSWDSEWYSVIPFLRARRSPGLHCWAHVNTKQTHTTKRQRR